MADAAINKRVKKIVRINKINITYKRQMQRFEKKKINFVLSKN